MTHYDYKVVPAPRRAKRVKGVRNADELFALTLTDAINEVARQGWEYVRAEHLPAETGGGWLSRGTTGEQTVLVFRRPHEPLGPRLASVRPEHGTAPLPAEPAVTPVPPPAQESAAEKAALDRIHKSYRNREFPVRMEPRLGDMDETSATPLRPSPRLGPAEKA